MRRVFVILAVAAAAAAVVSALRRRPDDAPRPAPPREGPVRSAVGVDVGAESPPNRFVELAADEQSRRHEAAERLKADPAGR